MTPAHHADDQSGQAVADRWRHRHDPGGGADTGKQVRTVPWAPARRYSDRAEWQVEFYFPLATSLLLSIALTILLNVVIRIFRK